MYKDDFITQLKLELSNPTLAFNSDGICRLIIDNKLIIDLEWLNNDSLYLFSEIGSSQVLSKNQLVTLLEANAFGQGTGKACLAIHNQQILFHQFFANNALNMTDFVQALESYIAHALQWQHYLLLPENVNNSVKITLP